MKISSISECTPPHFDRMKLVKYVHDTKENGRITISMVGEDGTLAEVLQVRCHTIGCQ